MENSDNSYAMKERNQALCQDIQDRLDFSRRVRKVISLKITSKLKSEGCSEINQLQDFREIFEQGEIFIQSPDIKKEHLAFKELKEFQLFKW